MSEKDSRRRNPRFEGDNLQQNVATDFFALASKKGVTPAQLALAWVLHRGGDVVPIPGTKSPGRLAENAGAVAIKLSETELQEIEAVIPKVVGDRAEAAFMSTNFSARE
ncbi:hypothetical protein ACHHYP_06835 [Achlya hypogyna]|uniref:NADP-dependent oxidoreductase domain-containing protein n=1 Tax=Achlya hypogyna TaxID=1202772 RepID=A0A1V9YRX9_ACHHY|nr:hypothetical protein ACHHYP_06835 [Achlya hypogyna]